MSARWLRGMWAVTMVGGFVGCASTGPNLKSPTPERFALPPVDDARFSQPIAYPKETLNQDQVIKPNPSNGKLPQQTAPPITQPNAGRYGPGAAGAPSF